MIQITFQGLLTVSLQYDLVSNPVQQWLANCLILNQWLSITNEIWCQFKFRDAKPPSIISRIRHIPRLLRSTPYATTDRSDLINGCLVIRKFQPDHSPAMIICQTRTYRRSGVFWWSIHPLICFQLKTKLGEKWIGPWACRRENKKGSPPSTPPSSQTKRRRVESASLCPLRQAQGPIYQRKYFLKFISVISVLEIVKCGTQMMQNHWNDNFRKLDFQYLMNVCEAAASNLR